METAKLLGLAVRSVQLMVDRGDLQAWKTPGGHRRISRESVQRWLDSQGPASAPDTPAPGHPPARARPAPVGRGVRRPAKVLLIEDSAHFQNLVALLLRQQFPQVELRVADDGIAGLAMFGSWQPDVLVVDILMPGIDGATLITSLRTHEQFRNTQLIVVTSLDEEERGPFSFALQGVPLVHKPRLVAEFPTLLAHCLKLARETRP